MSIHRHRRVSSESAADLIDDELSIDEINVRFPEEWILMRVTEHDPDGWPVRGYVTVHAMTQEEMLNEMERQPKRPEHDRLPLYSFLAGPDLLIDSDPEYEAAVLDFAAQLEAARQTYRA